MQELGAKVLVASAIVLHAVQSRTSCKCNDLFSSANPEDMGKAMDIFASDEMQRWMFANMAPIRKYY